MHHVVNLAVAEMVFSIAPKIAAEIESVAGFEERINSPVVKK
jgi:hypothetical protein